MVDSVRVTVDQESVAVNPGDVGQAVITIQNLGAAVGVFSIEIEGLHPSWFTLTSNSVSLFPGDRTSTTLVLTPPRDSAALAQAYSTTVRVASQKDPGEQTEISFTLDVQSFYDFSLDLRPQRVTGKLASHTLSIVNTSNVDMPVKLNGEDAEGLCRFSFDPESPKVTPGSTSEVAVTVTGKRPLRGAPKAYQYTITGSPPEGTADPITVSGSLEAIARMPSWILRAVMVSLLLGML